MRNRHSLPPIGAGGWNYGRRAGRTIARTNEMSRPRQRIRLEDGLKLDLNKLLREGLGPPGRIPWPVDIRWASSRSGEIAKGWITIRNEGEDRGFVRIEIGKLDQKINLMAQPRHLGGRQWYFLCPVTGKKCSVVWLPPGATRFCSRACEGKGERQVDLARLIGVSGTYLRSPNGCVGTATSV